MILFVVAIKDSAIDAFGVPIFCQALGQAERGFGDDIADPTSPMHKHPADYILYQLGTFDTETGEFECARPLQLKRGVDYVSQ